MTHAKRKSNKILLQIIIIIIIIMIRKHTQIMYNKLKVMGNYISIYTHWAPSFLKNSKKIQFICGPCSPMCEF